MSSTRDEAEVIVQGVGLPDPAEAFWASSAGLTAVRGWARARRAGPYALLGEILLQVMARVPPNVMLPPLGSYDQESVQGSASLNQVYASVAASGLSKGLAHAISAQVMHWPAFLDAPVYASLGTGEGIASTYVACSRNPESKQYEMTRLAWSAVLSATEIDKFAALVTRKNATLGGTLRAAWSGEPLGEANASEDKRRYVPRDTYRLGIVLHVQPGRGGALLNDEEAAGGTPQRILWLPARDPDIPDTAPAAPRKITWKAPDEIKTANAELTARGLDQIADIVPVILPVCDRALGEIDRAAVARHRGESGALDGHALLVREKLAASLGIFLGHFGVTDEDWDMAGHLMSVSDRTRESVSQELRRIAERENEARGQGEAKRASMIRRAGENEETTRVQKRICEFLSAREWVRNSDLRKAIRADLRKYYDEVVEEITGKGLIEKRDLARDTQGHGGDGTEYRLSRDTR
jgi:hypothetical protein